MKSVIILLAFVVAVYSYPQVKQDDGLLQHSEVRDDHGQYSLSFKSDKGFSVSEQAFLKPNSDPNEPGYYLAKKGTNTFISPEGGKYTLTYTADENGYQAQGDHLPKNVPVPV